MISPEALSGFVLEELVAALLGASGYRLLVDPSQDPVALCAGPNGLRIRGRGADHQVDVLGQFLTDVPFSYPVRLFVEAKCRHEKTGLGDVRNALGVINDVNEHYSDVTARAALGKGGYERFHYRYALFSTSGFTADAVKYAFAQQISLVDLSDAAFRSLGDSARQAASEMRAAAVTHGYSTFPVRMMREEIRRTFGVGGPHPAADEEEDGDSPGVDIPGPGLRGDLAGVAAALSEREEMLVVGLGPSPFLVVFKPDNVERARRFLDTGGVRSADLSFAGQDDSAGQWTLSVSNDVDAPLLFRSAIPPELEAVVFGTSSVESAPRRERSFLVPGVETAPEIRFSPAPVSESADDRGAVATMRARALQTDLAVETRQSASPQWSMSAYVELLRRLTQEGRPQATIIRWAARNDGRIDRAQVYELAGYRAPRTLRGFTRPVTRITEDLVRDGYVDELSDWPLATRYSGPVAASHFTVPTEFVFFEELGLPPFPGDS